ncbi:hypothetical protein U1Q18_050961, partial [Sarracenia purpurea var. burkii]
KKIIISRQRGRKRNRGCWLEDSRGTPKTPRVRNHVEVFLVKTLAVIFTSRGPYKGRRETNIRRRCELRRGAGEERPTNGEAEYFHTKQLYHQVGRH